MKIPGKVEGGKFRPDNVAAWPIALREVEGKRVVVDIEAEKKHRSLRQNARHWAVIVPLAQHALNLKRGPDLLPLSKEQVHYLLVTAFGASEETDLGSVPVRSSAMDTKQFAQLDEKAALWLAECGYGLPDGPDAAVMVEEATA